MKKILKDKISLSDNNHDNIPFPKLQSSGLWAKTEVMASYDDIERDSNGICYFAKKIPTGISKLGETLFRTEKTEPLWTKSNMVPISGCQFAMEQLFGVEAPISIHSLYTNPNNGYNYHAGLENSTDALPQYDTPNGKKTVIHHPGTLVQLFGVGITGAAENDVTVYNVDYREYSLDYTRTVDGLTITGEMLPFRYTATELSSNDKKKYFGKKIDGNETRYYLKCFEKDPEIKHVWKVGADIDSEQLIDSGVDIWATNNTNNIESFTEIIMKITKEDVREWFASNGQSDRARINTIALYTGRYDAANNDFRDVRLFSKLIIPVEYLSLAKDLNLIYRVYTS